MENTLPTLLEDDFEPSVPLKHQQIRVKLIYGASWPLYIDITPDLLTSTITVQLCMIATTSLDSRANYELESGRRLDSETASVGCSGLCIPLLDAPHVAPLITPQWRRPNRRDRVTVPCGTLTSRAHAREEGVMRL
jgi:hypothetical protein